MDITSRYVTSCSIVVQLATSWYAVFAGDLRDELELGSGVRCVFGMLEGRVGILCTHQREAVGLHSLYGYRISMAALLILC